PTTTLNSSAASISGLLSFDAAQGGPAHDGRYNLAATADDGRGGTATKYITIIVHDTNRPPQFTSPDTIEIYEGASLNFHFVAQDPDGDTVYLQIENDPAFLAPDWLIANSSQWNSGTL